MTPETQTCTACRRTLPLADFRRTRWGTPARVCCECIASKAADTRHNRTATEADKPAAVHDPDFDSMAIGDVWRLMCRGRRWLESRGCKISLSGEYHHTTVRKLKPQ